MAQPGSSSSGGPSVRTVLASTVSAFGRSPGLPTSRSARISSKRSRQHDEPVATTCCACRRTRSRPSTTGARSATAGKAPQAAACYHKVVELKRQQALAFHDLGCVCISKAIRPGRSQSSARPSSTSLSLPRPIVIWGSCWLKAASAPRPWTTCRRQSTWRPADHEAAKLLAKVRGSK